MVFSIVISFDDYSFTLIEFEVVDGEGSLVFVFTLLNYFVGDPDKWTVELRLGTRCHVKREIILDIRQFQSQLRHALPQNNLDPLFSRNLNMTISKVIPQIWLDILPYCRATIDI